MSCDFPLTSKWVLKATIVNGFKAKLCLDKGAVKPRMLCYGESLRSLERSLYMSQVSDNITFLAKRRKLSWNVKTANT